MSKTNILTEKKPESVKPNGGSRRWASIRILFSVAAIAAALALTFMLRTTLALPWVWAFLIGINAVTLALYGYDKGVAKIKWFRVPELVFHVTAMAGGTPAAFLGQNLFHHKTSKGKFRRTFWLIVVLQLAVFGVWIYLSSNP